MVSFATVEGKNPGRPDDFDRRALSPGEVPGAVAVLAKTLMFNDAKNDSQMQRQCRQEKFAGHLRVIYLQRVAAGTANSFSQRAGSFVVQNMRHDLELIGADLQPVSQSWRTQK